tara:strand:- start:262 stop:381 length:120 start_codon:yes stop_codon:yes gene_type:complete
MKFDINICPVCGDNTEKIEEDYMIGNVHLDCFLKKEGLT